MVRPSNHLMDSVNNFAFIKKTVCVLLMTFGVSVMTQPVYADEDWYEKVKAASDKVFLDYKADVPKAAPDASSENSPEIKSAETPATAEAMLPENPRVDALIGEWLRVAEPPENAQGAQYTYNPWGQITGRGANGENLANAAKPAGAGDNPHAYVWTNLRKLLDSVNHCTLEEYVENKYHARSTAHCEGRYKKAAASAVNPADVIKTKRQEAEVIEDSLADLGKAYKNAQGGFDAVIKKLEKNNTELEQGLFATAMSGADPDKLANIQQAFSELENSAAEYKAAADRILRMKDSLCAANEEMLSMGEGHMGKIEIKKKSDAEAAQLNELYQTSSDQYKKIESVYAPLKISRGVFSSEKSVDGLLKETGALSQTNRETHSYLTGAYTALETASHSFDILADQITAIESEARAAFENASGDVKDSARRDLAKIEKIKQRVYDTGLKNAAQFELSRKKFEDKRQKSEKLRSGYENMMGNSQEVRSSQTIEDLKTRAGVIFQEVEEKHAAIQNYHEAGNDCAQTCSSITGSYPRRGAEDGKIWCECLGEEVYDSGKSACVSRKDFHLRTTNCSMYGEHVGTVWNEEKQMAMCQCDPGYSFLNIDSGKKCVPAKDYALQTNTCSRLGEHVSAKWSEEKQIVECQCDPGYVLNAQQTECVMSKAERVKNASCAAIKGSHPVWSDKQNTVVCQCSAGQVYDSNSNSCMNEKAHYERYGDCSSFGEHVKPVWDASMQNPKRCYCDPGYALDASKTKCVLSRQSQLDSVSCTHVPGSFKAWNDARGEPWCQCPSGTQLVNDAGGQKCVDAKEWAVQNASCGHLGPHAFPFWSSVDGGVMCTCTTGYVLNSNSTACVEQNFYASQPAPAGSTRREQLAPLINNMLEQLGQLYQQQGGSSSSSDSSIYGQGNYSAGQSSSSNDVSYVSDGPCAATSASATGYQRGMSNCMDYYEEQKRVECGHLPYTHGKRTFCEIEVRKRILGS